MKKVRNTIIFLIIVSILFLMGACGSNNSEQILQTEPSEDTILVIDSFGREVQVPEKVDRIAALYSFAGYAVSLLGSGNDLVGVPGGLKRDVLLTEIFPKIADASVPRSGTINIEELLRINPDVVIIRGDTAVNEKEVEKLDNSGIPYIIVEFSTMKEQQEAISIIGKAIGKSQEAEEFNNYYNDVIARVDEVIKDIPLDERVRVYHSENQATRTIHKNSLAADWSKAAGIINVSVGEELELEGNDYYANIEQILLWDPEVIIANETSAIKVITGHPQWSGISAVRNGKVYKLPQGISRWGHPGSVETPLAILWTAKTAYPDKFEHIDIKEEVRYFYKTFFNWELDDDMVETILRGEDLRKPK